MAPRKFPLQAHLAEHLFLAEHGPSGLKWDDLSDERWEDYMRTAGCVLEGFYAGRGRVVVLDSMNDEFWIVASPTPEATEPTCATCGGSGRVLRRVPSLGDSVFRTGKPCPDCQEGES